MNKFCILTLAFIPLFVLGQQGSSIESIDSLIYKIDNDSTIVIEIRDSVSYEKEDGGTHWDSLYHHRETYYKDGQLVKVIQWSKYKARRQDMLAYYLNGKTIKFSEGEFHEKHPNYGMLEFEIYYYQDKEIKVQWLTPKPDNVVGVDSDIYLKWSYQIQEGKW